MLDFIAYKIRFINNFISHMFWGCQLKENKSHKLGDHSELSSLIHISNASLANGQKATVVAKVGQQEFVLSVLENNGRANQTLDLYFRV